MNRFRVIGLSIAAIVCVNAQAREFSMERLYATIEKPHVERVNALYFMLTEEVKQPSEPFLTVYMPIEKEWKRLGHDYAVQQLCAAIGDAAVQSPQAGDVVRTLRQREKDKRIRDLLCVSLGFAEDTNVAGEIVDILKNGEGWVVTGAADGLTKMSALHTIPEILRASDGPNREAAREVLRAFGVITKAQSEAKPEMLERQAVNVLMESLKSQDGTTAARLVEAIARIGGKEAKKAVLEIITANEGHQDRKQVVEKAKSVLPGIR